jgi:predicted  nucleic acid-binding Zn-ribbon protein
MDACEKRCKTLQVEQKEIEIDIQAKQAQITKYNTQLLAVKKNEEYQALLHEIELIKKQVGLREERQIAIMLELDEAKARLEEDRKRIQDELKGIEKQCTLVDEELKEAISQRKQLEQLRGPAAEKVRHDLMHHYSRIRSRMKTGRVVVPLNDEVCTGCHMKVIPQVVNELLAGDKLHTCKNCGRLLYATQALDRVADTV